ncbi:hypothetical protein AO955_26505 [Pseudomonas aeruginosa]|nr:hypothetical protein AO955_26505 [Pseudomonas aeruginosa]
MPLCDIPIIRRRWKKHFGIIRTSQDHRQCRLIPSLEIGIFPLKWNIVQSFNFIKYADAAKIPGSQVAQLPGFRQYLHTSSATPDRQQFADIFLKRHTPVLGRKLMKAFIDRLRSIKQVTEQCELAAVRE